MTRHGIVSATPLSPNSSMQLERGRCKQVRKELTAKVPLSAPSIDKHRCLSHRYWMWIDIAHYTPLVPHQSSTQALTGLMRRLIGT